MGRGWRSAPERVPQGIPIIPFRRIHCLAPASFTHTHTHTLADTGRTRSCSPWESTLSKPGPERPASKKDEVPWTTARNTQDYIHVTFTLDKSASVQASTYDTPPLGFCHKRLTIVWRPTPASFLRIRPRYISFCRSPYLGHCQHCPRWTTDDANVPMTCLAPASFTHPPQTADDRIHATRPACKRRVASMAASTSSLPIPSSKSSGLVTPVTPVRATWV